jgi:hypothetical protein
MADLKKLEKKLKEKMFPNEIGTFQDKYTFSTERLAKRFVQDMGGHYSSFYYKRKGKTIFRFRKLGY